MKDNTFKSLKKENKNRKNQLVLFVDKVYRLKGVTQDEWDYYYKVSDIKGDITLISAVLAPVYLKDNMKESDYYWTLDLFEQNEKR